MSEIWWTVQGGGGQVLVVRVPEALNHETAPGLTEVVRRRMPAVDGVGVVLDMAGAEMITSIGITALLEAEEATREVGGRLVLAGLSDEMGAFLRMLGLARRFETVGEVEDGVVFIEQGKPG